MSIISGYEFHPTFHFQLTLGLPAMSTGQRFVNVCDNTRGVSDITRSLSMSFGI